MTITMTVLFLPVYLLVRLGFARLPLHFDSGFYVSNNTIATRRICFAKGWNAHFAGCSKVVPEFFYSLIYLLHTRPSSNRLFTKWGYKGWSRLYASLFNYATAIGVGLLVFLLTDGDRRAYVSALVIYALLSSEPHWGSYFECGELFENLANVAAMLFLLVGLERGELSWFGFAAFAWTMSSFFVKLSSTIGFFILFGGCAYLYPTTIPAILLGAGGSAMLYLIWIVANGRHPVALVRSLIGHEASYNQWRGLWGVGYRCMEKARCLGKAVWCNPILPALAVVGAMAACPSEPVFWLYTTAVVVAYLAQATDCRYYLLPLTPVVAVLATGGLVIIMSLGPTGLLNAAGLVAIWVIAIPVRAMFSSTACLNRWCWKGGISDHQACGNLLIDASGKALRELCRGESLAVYGPLNQAYVLAETSWPTPIVTPEYYMDHVHPGWQNEHNRRLLASPPRWILDTGECFDAKNTRHGLGLDYCCRYRFGRTLRLYRLEGISQPADRAKNVVTYRVQTRADLFAEEVRGGDDFVVYDDENDTFFNDESAGDPSAWALSELLRDLAKRGYHRLAVYGAGRFTLRHAEVYRQSAAPVSIVLDDNSELDGKTCADWPIRGLDHVSPDDFDAVIISTDRFTRAMLARIRKRFGYDVPAFTINA